MSEPKVHPLNIYWWRSKRALDFFDVFCDLQKLLCRGGDGPCCSLAHSAFPSILPPLSLSPLPLSSILTHSVVQTELYPSFGLL